MNATSDLIVLIKSLWVPYNVSTTDNLANTYKKQRKVHPRADHEAPERE
jgi:hypothetical protein